MDYMKYQKRFIDKNILKKRLKELSELGLKSIMYAGEGEPLLHDYIGDIIQFTKGVNIDCSLTTNGVLFNRLLAQQILPFIKWVKFSVNAGTNGTYSDIHRCHIQDFDKVLFNIEYACNLKKSDKLDCAIGVQILELPENNHEILCLAEIVKDLGVDYFVVKPYSQHLMSSNRRYENVKYKDWRNNHALLEQLESDNFNVIYRSNTMQKWNNKKREYKRCLGLPFWSYIDAGGNVWGCSAHLSRETMNFNYGNIYEQSFKDIWNGEIRQKNIKWVENTMDVSKCRINCRMDDCNKYLWELKNPNPHVNFI